MIISLEYILLFSPLGEMSFSWALYKQISIYDMGLTIFAVLYLFVLPIDRINRLFFPRVSLEEVEYFILIID